MTVKNPTAVSIHPVLAQRWSPRGFSATSNLDEATVQALFEAARWAPSASNSQPWGFIAAHRGSEAFEKIHATLADFNAVWTVRPALLIATFAQTEQDGQVVPWAQYDLGQAAAHLTFQAEALGLNVHQMGGFDADAIRTAFDVDETYKPVTVIAVGEYDSSDDVPEEIRQRDASPRDRKPYSELFLVPVA